MELEFRSLPGLTPYEDARALQMELVEKRVHDQIPDTVLLLEHPAVITRGRGLQFTGEERPRAMPLLGPLPKDVAFAESERGGDLTLHSPGQLVIYPIVKLDGRGFGPHHDIDGFLRKCERVLMEFLAGHGLQAGTKPGATGVWVGERKIASIGIAVRRWVTWHGLALNLANDLSLFRLISPCGFQPEVMTRLQDFKDLGPSWREDAERALMTRFRA